MAVAVEEQIASIGVAEEGADGLGILAIELDEEFVEEEGGLSDAAGVLGGNELGVFVAQGEQAGGLDADDGGAGDGVGCELIDVAGRPLASGPELALRDERTTAAAEALDDGDAVAERLEDGGGGTADLRLVVLA